MHPLLRSRRGLLGCAAWGAVVAVLLVWVSRNWAAAPAGFVYVLVCLTPWYLCRGLPVTPARLPGVVFTWLIAATCASLVVLGAAHASTALLNGNQPLNDAQLAAVAVLVYLLSAGVHYAALGLLSAHAAEQRAAESTALAREAELAALRAQVDPHFLFNSLNSISALTSVDAAGARAMCEQLAGFLRGSLTLGARAEIALGDELALIRAYLDVERVRFGDRLTVEESIEPECAPCAVPPLVLQPLVENAIKHGVAGLLEGGTIRITAVRTRGYVTVAIENPFDSEAVAESRSGIGLANVRRRLDSRYGDRASFAAGPEGERYRVELRFPCEPCITSSSRE